MEFLKLYARRNCSVRVIIKWAGEALLQNRRGLGSNKSLNDFSFIALENWDLHKIY